MSEQPLNRKIVAPGEFSIGGTNDVLLTRIDSGVAVVLYKPERRQRALAHINYSGRIDREDWEEFRTKTLEPQTEQARTLLEQALEEYGGEAYAFMFAIPFERPMKDDGRDVLPPLNRMKYQSHRKLQELGIQEPNVYFPQQQRRPEPLIYESQIVVNPRHMRVIDYKSDGFPISTHEAPQGARAFKYHKQLTADTLEPPQ